MSFVQALKAQLNRNLSTIEDQPTKQALVEVQKAVDTLAGSTVPYVALEDDGLPADGAPAPFVQGVYVKYVTPERPVPDQELPLFSINHSLGRRPVAGLFLVHAGPDYWMYAPPVTETPGSTAYVPTDDKTILINPGSAPGTKVLMVIW